MAESYVQVTEGTGKKLHTFTRTASGNTVHDEVTIRGEQYLPTYFAFSSTVTMGTAGSHLIEIMAGSSLNVRLRRVRIMQVVAASAVAMSPISIMRISTAGTGGTAISTFPFDSADSASGATAMTLPTSKGTEGTAFVYTQLFPFLAALPNSFVWEWTEMEGTKPIIIPSGVTNGIAVRNAGAITSASVAVSVEFSESSF